MTGRTERKGLGTEEETNDSVLIPQSSVLSRRERREPERVFGDLDPPPRLLMGSGPSNPDPRVLRAMATPLVGQFDPAFTDLMDETMALSRLVFQTQNRRAFPVSGASRSGLEAAVASLLQEGERMVVVNFGRFGDLLCDLGRRYGADVESVDAEWGTVVDPARVEAILRARPARVVAAVHADTSTGVVQPLADLARLAHETDALLLVDAVLSLGGCEVDVDGWGLDVAVAGLQKCLGGPPGMAPLTYSPRAEAVLHARHTPPRTSYLDLLQLQEYWGPGRLNHHTAPTSMVYATREALRLVHVEGLAARWERHQRAGEALAAGLEAMGLRLFGDRRHKAPMIALVEVPEGVSEPGVRRDLLERFGIEIMAAFGLLLGRVWRIGTMGYNARLETVLLTLGALEAVLAEHGHRLPPGAAVAAAQQRWMAPTHPALTRQARHA